MTKDARPGLPDPGFVEIDSFHAGNFLAPLTALRDQKEAYLASTWRSSFLQNIGTYESYVGNYGKAHQYFVQFENDSGIIDHPTLPTSDFAAVDAVPEIIATATANQVVFINEAHHLLRPG